MNFLILNCSFVNFGLCERHIKSVFTFSRYSWNNGKRKQCRSMFVFLCIMYKLIAKFFIWFFNLIMVKEYYNSDITLFIYVKNTFNCDSSRLLCDVTHVLKLMKLQICNRLNIFKTFQAYTTNIINNNEKYINIFLFSLINFQVINP